MVSINKIKKPTKIVADLDSLLFAAASSAQDVVYRYHTQDESFAVEFPSATEGKHWLECIEAFGGYDTLHGYSGDLDDLIRTVRYDVGDVKTATKTFDKLLEEALEEIPHKQWKGKVASKSGARCHRNDICTLYPYKGNRDSSKKPYYLDDVRRHALKYKQVSKSTGGRESDDFVCAIAQKYGSDCVLWMQEKDGFGVTGTWFYAPNLMDEMYYSDENIIGEIWIDEKGRMKGAGLMFWIAQAIAGDSADNYKGCKGVGPKGAVNLLEPFSGKGWNHLKPCIHSVLEVFRDAYGDKYEYNHCYTGEKMVASFKDVFLENMLLAYMVKFEGDKPDNIIKLVEEFK